MPSIIEAKLAWRSLGQGGRDPRVMACELLAISDHYYTIRDTIRECWLRACAADRSNNSTLMA